MNKYNAIEEKNKQKAIIEAADSYTVAISAEGEKEIWGSGTALKFRKKFYILTASHVIIDEPINHNLRFIPKGDGSLEIVSKCDILKNPTSNIAKSYATKLPILGRIVSDEIDDLSLLLLDSSVVNIKNFNFFEILEKPNTPSIGTIGTQVGMLGFSREIARKTGIINSKFIEMGVLPYFDWSKIVATQGRDLKNFDENRHFLIEFTKTETSCSPYGLSGCGIWALRNSGAVWSANLHLVGVENAFYEGPQIIKATRIERALDLLQKNY